MYYIAWTCFKVTNRMFFIAVAISTDHYEMKLEMRIRPHLSYSVVSNALLFHTNCVCVCVCVCIGACASLGGGVGVVCVCVCVCARVCVNFLNYFMLILFPGA